MGLLKPQGYKHGKFQEIATGNHYCFFCFVVNEASVSMLQALRLITYQNLRYTIHWRKSKNTLHFWLNYRK